MKPSSKRMESSYYMALSDRARNYEATGTGFAFLGFFYKLLGILGDQHIKRISGPVQPVHYTGLTGEHRFNWPPQAVRPLTASGARQSRAPLSAALRRRHSRRRGAGQRQRKGREGPARLAGLRARGSGTGARPRAWGDERAAAKRRRTVARSVPGEGGA